MKPLLGLGLIMMLVAGATLVNAEPVYDFKYTGTINSVIAADYHYDYLDFPIQDTSSFNMTITVDFEQYNLTSSGFSISFVNSTHSPIGLAAPAVSITSVNATYAKVNLSGNHFDVLVEPSITFKISFDNSTGDLVTTVGTNSFTAETLNYVPSYIRLANQDRVITGDDLTYTIYVNKAVALTQTESMLYLTQLILTLLPALIGIKLIKRLF